MLPLRVPMASVRSSEEGQPLVLGRVVAGRGLSAGGGERMEGPGERTGSAAGLGLVPAGDLDAPGDLACSGDRTGSAAAAPPTTEEPTLPVRPLAGLEEATEVEWATEEEPTVEVAAIQEEEEQEMSARLCEASMPAGTTAPGAEGAGTCAGPAGCAATEPTAVTRSCEGSMIASTAETRGPQLMDWRCSPPACTLPPAPLLVVLPACCLRGLRDCMGGGGSSL